MSAPIGNVRLPSPPSEYNESYMSRLINTLELLLREQASASSSSSNITTDKSETFSWFIE